MSGKDSHFGCIRGYVLVAFSLSLLVTLGAVGLSVDVGRMYITRGEARSFCDAAAIAAALQLDGTTAGITRANDAALATVKGWEFGTKQFDPSNATIQVEFGRISGGHRDFSVAPNPAATTAPGYVCARVSVSNVNLPMFLMPVLTNVFSSKIAARATAAQVRLPGPGAGAYSPFSPFAHPILDPPPADAVPDNPGDPFNLKPGEKYTLVWPNEAHITNGSKTLLSKTALAVR
jgi:Flp pilus assembly protein TadG